MEATSERARRTMEVVRFMAECASLAPSNHNSQPWRFRALPDGLEVLADRARRLPVHDPEDRELTLSCAAAAYNARVAALRMARAPVVRLLPREAAPDALVEVRFDGPRAVTEDDGRLSGAIQARRTFRRPFVARAVLASVTSALVDAARREGAALIPVEEAVARDGLCALVGEADRVLWSRPEWRREESAWLHRAGAGDGPPRGPLSVPLQQLFTTAFDRGSGEAARDEVLAREAPLLAVVMTAGDTRPEWLLAGQAMQAVLLRAAVLGLQASFLNQPNQVPALRAAVADELGVRGAPQVILRFGYPAADLPATPRRPLEELLVD